LATAKIIAAAAQLFREKLPMIVFTHCPFEFEPQETSDFANLARQVSKPGAQGFYKKPDESVMKPGEVDRKLLRETGLYLA
jgi:hypothetical protein